MRWSSTFCLPKNSTTLPDIDGAVILYQRQYKEQILISSNTMTYCLYDNQVGDIWMA